MPPPDERTDGLDAPRRRIFQPKEEEEEHVDWRLPRENLSTRHTTQGKTRRRRSVCRYADGLFLFSGGIVYVQYMYSIRGEEEKADGNGWAGFSVCIYRRSNWHSRPPGSILYRLASSSTATTAVSLYKSREMTALNWRTSAPWSRGESWEFWDSQVNCANGQVCVRATVYMCVCVCVRSAQQQHVFLLLSSTHLKRRKKKKRRTKVTLKVDKESNSALHTHTHTHNQSQIEFGRLSPPFVVGAGSSNE